MTDIGSDGGEADSRVGVTVNVPAGAVRFQTLLSIRECSGPFRLPDNVYLASPVFLIGSSQPKFKRNARLSMEHFADLRRDGGRLVYLTSPRKAPLRHFSKICTVYDQRHGFGPVSYTHLTLPTIYSV